MAIQVEIKDAGIQDNQLVLAISTTNDAFPGEEQRCSFSYPTTQTATQIQTAVNEGVTRLWQALSNRQWTI